LRIAWPFHERARLLTPREGSRDLIVKETNPWHA
jgi:hypothetical protein